MEGVTSSSLSTNTWGKFWLPTGSNITFFWVDAFSISAVYTVNKILVLLNRGVEIAALCWLVAILRFFINCKIY